MENLENFIFFKSACLAGTFSQDHPALILNFKSLAFNPLSWPGTLCHLFRGFVITESTCRVLQHFKLSGNKNQNNYNFHKLKTLIQTPQPHPADLLMGGGAYWFLSQGTEHPQWHQASSVAPSIANGTKYLQWHQMSPMVPSIFNGTTCYQWLQMSPLKPSIPNGTKCLQWYQASSMAPSNPGGTKCLQWHQAPPLAPNVSIGTKHPQWHQMSPIAPHIPTGTEHPQWHQESSQHWISPKAPSIPIGTVHHPMAWPEPHMAPSGSGWRCPSCKLMGPKICCCLEQTNSVLEIWCLFKLHYQELFIMV